MSVRAKTEGNRISLNSGFHCKLNTGSCVDPEGGNTFWDPVPRRYCLDNTYTMLYQGPSTRLETKSETIFTVNVRDTSFSVAITGLENSCGLNIYRTEHPKLLIVPGKDRVYLKGIMQFKQTPIILICFYTLTLNSYMLSGILDLKFNPCISM